MRPSCPSCFSPQAHGVSIWAAPRRPNAPQRRWSTDPGDWRGQTRDQGAGPDFAALCPRIGFQGQARTQHAKEPKPESRRCGIKLCGSGGCAGAETLAAGWLGHCTQASTELSPLARNPGPGIKTPPPVPTVLQSLVWPQSHLDAGSGSRGPGSSPPPGSWILS